MRRSIFPPFAVFASTLACVSCGAAQTPTHQDTSVDHRSDSADPSAPQEAKPQLPSCDDGSCFACGEGICPTGFYCESNGGVTGCQWSMACAKAPTCRCLQPTLKADSRCSCEDRNGTAFVTCSK